MKTKDKELIDLENAVSNEQSATDDNLGKNEKTMTDNNAVKSDNDKKFGFKKNKEKKVKATESKEENTKTEDGETDEVVVDAVEGENKDKPKSKARTATKRIAFSAVFMALIIVFTSFIIESNATSFITNLLPSLSAIALAMSISTPTISLFL